MPARRVPGRVRRGARRPEVRLPGALPGAHRAQRRLPSRAPRRGRMAGRCAARWREGHRGDVGEGLLTARGTASLRRRPPAVGLLFSRRRVRKGQRGMIRYPYLYTCLHMF